MNTQKISVGYDNRGRVSIRAALMMTPRDGIDER